MMVQSRRSARLRAYVRYWVDRGYQEVINFAFVEQVREADFAAKIEEVDLIRLANPIASQMAVMRSTLLGGLIGNLQTPTSSATTCSPV